MKTKKIAGTDLNASSFAYVGDLEDPATWKLPLFIPGNAGLTRNMIKNAVERFATTKIPDERRAEVWRVIVGACRAHASRLERSRPLHPAQRILKPRNRWMNLTQKKKKLEHWELYTQNVC